MAPVEPTNPADLATDRAVKLAENLRVASLAAERELAEAIIAIRGHITTRSGGTDWLGATGEAKGRASEVYAAIPMDADNLRRLKGRIRQHFMTILADRDRSIPAGDANDVFLVERFFDDLGVFLGEYSRRSSSSIEAMQLALAATRLLNLIDTGSVTDGPNVSLVVRDVQDQAASLARRLRHNPSRH